MAGPFKSGHQTARTVPIMLSYATGMPIIDAHDEFLAEAAPDGVTRPQPGEHGLRAEAE